MELLCEEVRKQSDGGYGRSVDQYTGQGVPLLLWRQGDGRHGSFANGLYCSDGTGYIRKRQNKFEVACLSNFGMLHLRIGGCVPRQGVKEHKAARLGW